MEKINEMLGIADKAVASTKHQTVTVIPRPQTSEEDEDDFGFNETHSFFEDAKNYNPETGQDE